MQPHEYVPDLMAMGDCRVCGHGQDAHRDRGDWKRIETLPEDVKSRHAKKIGKMAKAIFLEMNSIMHDHDAEWNKCNQKIYFDCAEAADAACSTDR